MPSLAAWLSGAASFTALAGVLTGMCYVLMFGVRWFSQLQATLPGGPHAAPAAAPSTDSCCARCGRSLHALPLGRSRRLHCAHCHLPVCRHCCDQASNTRWLCVSCRKLRDVRLQSGEWFYQQLRQRFRSKVAALGNLDEKDEEVQEFMENLVENIIGGGLDDVILQPLSDRPEYTNFCAVYKEVLVHVLERLYANLKMSISDSGSQNGETELETASVLHTELKELMKQIIREAMAQPQLKEGNGQSSWSPPSEDSPDSLKQRSYEDILATAILNKVFDKYQNNKTRRKFWNNETTFDKNSNLLSEKLPGAMQESESDDTDSVPNSVDSWSESSHQGPLSVTKKDSTARRIEECIEEVTTRYSSDEEPQTELDRFLSSLKYVKRQRAVFPELGKDIVDGEMSSSEEGVDTEQVGSDKPRDLDELSVGVEQLNPVDSWEENWLFQRRQLRHTGPCQPVPVPMLVPRPDVDCRAMIGGVDADDMSDLSDCSDTLLEDLVDGSDDKKYFESQLEDESDEEKSNVADQQRDMFLQYISDDLNKLIKPDESNRGISPDTGQSDGEVGSQVVGSSDIGLLANLEQLPLQQQSLDGLEEMDSSHSYSVAEARNLSVPVVQVDSGEGSLDMQQDREYTVAYATLAEVRSNSLEPSPCPTPSPVPRPRSAVPPTTTNDVPIAEESDVERRNSLSELSIPPKPGTIAEREHLKWEKAPPLANNPYSKENIARRHRQRMYLSRHSSSDNSIEFPELTGTKEPSLLEIDCKHRREDYNKYVRDYYVNVADGSECELVQGRDVHQYGIRGRDNYRVEQHRTVAFEGLPSQGGKQSISTPATPQTSSDQKPQSSQPENSCSQQQVSVRVEVEVALSKASNCPGKPTHTQTTATKHQVSTVVPPDEDKSYISLPSVKQLAKQFNTADNKVPTPISPIPARKQSEIKLHSPIRQVHSLTARNISREMRDSLRGKKEMVAIVKVVSDKDKECDKDSSGHVSEDSGTVSPTPCPQAPPRRLKLKEGIQFWEQMNQQS